MLTLSTCCQCGAPASRAPLTTTGTHAETSWSRRLPRAGRRMISRTTSIPSAGMSRSSTGESICRRCVCLGELEPSFSSFVSGGYLDLASLSSCYFYSLPLLTPTHISYPIVPYHTSLSKNKKQLEKLERRYSTNLRCGGLHAATALEK